MSLAAWSYTNITHTYLPVGTTEAAMASTQPALVMCCALQQSAAQAYGMGPYAAAQGGFAYPPYSVHGDMQDQASSASEETKE